MAYLFEQYTNLWITATKGDDGHKILNPRYIVSISYLHPEYPDDQYRRDAYEVIDIHGHKHMVKSTSVVKGQHAWWWLRENLKELTSSMNTSD